MFIYTYGFNYVSSTEALCVTTHGQFIRFQPDP